MAEESRHQVIEIYPWNLYYGLGLSFAVFVLGILAAGLHALIVFSQPKSYLLKPKHDMVLSEIQPPPSQQTRKRRYGKLQRDSRPEPPSRFFYVDPSDASKKPVSTPSQLPNPEEEFLDRFKQDLRYYALPEPRIREVKAQFGSHQHGRAYDCERRKVSELCFSFRDIKEIQGDDDSLASMVSTETDSTFSTNDKSTASPPRKAIASLLSDPANDVSEGARTGVSEIPLKKSDELHPSLFFSPK